MVQAVGVVMALLIASPAFAQAALAATAIDPDKLPPETHITLRPAEGLEELAARLARVLALRTGAIVEVGDTPPPGLLEAVPAGHVALARRDGQLHLVLGAAFGRSYDSSVHLPDSYREADVRSVALAVESLRDRAIEARERFERTQVRTQVEPAAVSELAAPETAQQPAVPTPPAARPAAAGFDDRSAVLGGLPYTEGKYLKPVEPLFYLSAYTGASSGTAGPRMGVGMGGGLCVQGHCLRLGMEYPMPIGVDQNARDIRYRYTTFTAGFYTHPISFGCFTPGASIGFLSRLGYFERDMGLPSNGDGLDTDLGVRGTMEGAFKVASAVELLAEGGVDYALDRWRMGGGYTVYRGDHTTPWLQAAVRVRPY